MKVKSIVEWSILHYFWPALSDNWSWIPIFGLFESVRFTQVLLSIQQCRKSRHYGDRELIISTYSMSQKLRGTPRLLSGKYLILLDDEAKVKIYFIL